LWLRSGVESYPSWQAMRAGDRDYVGHVHCGELEPWETEAAEFW
jgi:hypothetical protein